MADPFTIAEAQLVVLFLSSVAYGIHLIMLGMCVRILACKSHPRKNALLIGATALLFFFLSTKGALMFRDNLNAFVLYGAPVAQRRPSMMQRRCRG